MLQASPHRPHIAARLSSLSVVAIALAATLLPTYAAWAQSDPANFGTVYNIGNVPAGSMFDIPGAVRGTEVGDNDYTRGNAGILTPEFLRGDTLGSDSQLNIFDGGKAHKNFDSGASTGTGSNIEVNLLGGFVSSSFYAYSGSTINIKSGAVYELRSYSGSIVNLSGGYIGTFSKAYSGSLFNVAGGAIGRRYTIYPGSVANLSGGTFGDEFSVLSGSAVNFTGHNFRINNSEVSDLTDGFGGGDSTDLFTGLLADGSVFIFAGQADDTFAANTTALHTVGVAASSNPGVLSSGVFSKGVRAGETLTVNSDGELADDFAVVAGTLNIENGSVGDGLEVAYGEVNLSGGSVGQHLRAFAGSTVNIRGGSVGRWSAAYPGSIVSVSGGFIDGRFSTYADSIINISGGTIAENFNSRPNSTVNLAGGSIGFRFISDSSTVNITGGSVGKEFAVFNGSTVNLSGGSIAKGFSVRTDSNLNIFGGYFRHNGAMVDDNSDVFSGQSSTGLLTGVLADGSVFIFARDNSDFFEANTVKLENAEVAPSQNPGMLANGEFSKGLRAGEVLSLTGDGRLGDNFSVVSATLDISGGSTGDNLKVAYSKVRISAGSVGSDFSIFSGSEVNISGGTIGNDATAHHGSTVNISDGAVGNGFNAFNSSIVNLSGGSVGILFGARNGSVVNLSGGSIGNFFWAYSGSTVNLFGSTFLLDGVELTELNFGESLLISDRDVTLSGTLADSSAFDFELNSSYTRGEDLFESGVTLTITLTSQLAGDYNNDGIVDAADYTVWRNHLGAPAGTLLNDFNGGVIGDAQFLTWRSNYGMTYQAASSLDAAAVPEPTAAIMLSVLASLISGYGRRRRM